MRISDWSSDVCSSDLQAPRTAQVRTVAYASVAKPAASPGQPVVTFTAEREGESGGQPLLRTASYRARPDRPAAASVLRSEEPTSELQSLMRISYAVFCLKKKKWL